MFNTLQNFTFYRTPNIFPFIIFSDLNLVYLFYVLRIYIIGNQIGILVHYPTWIFPRNIVANRWRKIQIGKSFKRGNYFTILVVSCNNSPVGLFKDNLVPFMVAIINTGLSNIKSCRCIFQFLN